MTLRTDKDLKSKFKGEKSLYIKQGSRFKKKLKSKPKQFWLEKGIFFGSP